jgi:hypothetical protein
MLAHCREVARLHDGERGLDRPRGNGEELKVSVTFLADESLVTSMTSVASPDNQRRIGKAQGENVAGATSAARRLPAASRSGARRGRAILAALGIIGGIVLVALPVARPDLVLRALPRLAPVYAAAGLTVNLRGLAFERVTARFDDIGGGRFLAVEGILRNVAAEARDAPRLRVTLSDAKGRPVYFWTTGSGVKTLAAGETAPFRARLAAPPAEAQSVTVDFAP